MCWSAESISLYSEILTVTGHAFVFLWVYILQSIRPLIMQPSPLNPLGRTGTAPWLFVLSPTPAD